MHDTLAAQVEAVWYKLQRQFQWSLVQEQAAIIRSITQDLVQQAGQINEQQIKLAIQQAYAQCLYDAIMAMRMNNPRRHVQPNANLACDDIYTMAFRRALNLGADEELARDIAQEVVKVLITNPEKVREPKALFTWVWYQVRDFTSRYRRAKPVDSLDQVEQRTNNSSILVSNTNVSKQIEDKLFAQAILDLLATILSPLQHQIIDLVCFQELTPRDAAQMLNTSAHHVRVEKSRALAKIRSHPVLQAWIDAN